MSAAGAGAIAPPRSGTARDAFLECARARLNSLNCAVLGLNEDFLGKTWAEVIAVRIVNAAARGDVAAARLVLEFLGSEPVMASEVAVAVLKGSH